MAGAAGTAGAAGATGPTGATGPAGSDGASGTNGVDGATGPTGATGASGVGVTVLIGGTADALPLLGGTRYVTPGVGRLASTAAEAAAPMPAGTVANLRVRMSANPGADVDVTVYKNGSGTALACTVDGPGSASCSDTGNSITTVAGDQLAVRIDSPALSTLYLNFTLTFAQ